MLPRNMVKCEVVEYFYALGHDYVPGEIVEVPEEFYRRWSHKLKLIKPPKKGITKKGAPKSEVKAE